MDFVDIPAQKSRLSQQFFVAGAFLHLIYLMAVIFAGY